MIRGGRSRLRSIGHGIFYAIMGVVLAGFLVLAIGIAVSGVQPTYSGTFTQSGCDYARNGCLPVGTWRSDDGSIVKKDIHLDGGTVGTGGTVRAVYTPTGFSNDSENNIVHVPIWGGARYWAPWVFALVIVGVIVYYSRKWRRQAVNRG
jgi:hypothetical protein